MARPNLLFLCLFTAVLVVPDATTAASAPRSCGCGDLDLEKIDIWLDMVFIIDSSDDIMAEDFSSVKELLRQIALYVDPQDPPEKHSRVAILNTAITAEVFASIDRYSSSDEMKDDVATNLKQRGGVFNITAGLVTARDIVENEDVHGERPNVKRAVIVLTKTSYNCSSPSAKSVYDPTVCLLFSQLEGGSTTLIVVGLKTGPGMDSFPVVDIPNKCNYVRSDEKMMLNLLRTFCFANCFCANRKDAYLFAVPENCQKYAECLIPDDFAFSYSAALETCTRLEGDTLASASSEEKDQFMQTIQSKTGSTPFWVGINNTDGQLFYSDGTPLGEDDYTNWCHTAGQPDYTNKKNCIYEKACGQTTAWYTDRCGSFLPTHFYACQKPACTAANYCE